MKDRIKNANAHLAHLQAQTHLLTLLLAKANFLPTHK
jgi:hypothetical protein